MGVQLNTFYHLINGRETNGTRWVITKHKIGESEPWEKNLEMLKSGALGDSASPKTLLRYWQMQENAGYPNAMENVKYFKDMVNKETR